MAELNSTALLADGNLQAYWRFESGADTTDSSSNSNTLTHVNTPTNEGGKFGNCMHYDPGSTEYSYTGDSASLSLTGQYTISCWVNMDSLPASNDSYMAVIDKYHYDPADGGTVTGYFIDFNKTGGGVQRMRAVFGYVPGLHALEASYTVTLSTGTWHHLVARHDGTTLELWVDGVERASADSTGINPGDNAENLAIGRLQGSSGRHLDGSVDDVGVFDRALTDGEIATLYSDVVTSTKDVLGGGIIPFER